MITQDIKDKLRHLPGGWREDVVLAKSCWFNVGGKADLIYKPSSVNELAEIIKLTKSLNVKTNILGVGSNILVRDRGIRGVVIKLGKEFNYIKIDHDLLEVGGAVLDANLACYAQDMGFNNFEFLVGVPGTIGGALAMNAGCYSGEIKDIFVKAELVDMQGNIRIINFDEISYSYRKHNLEFTPIFTRAWFKLETGDKSLIKAKIDDIIFKREQSQPLRSKTGGSTFRNPDPNESELKAWQLIDKAGLRGASLGGAKFSELHCNFLINYNNALASDLENLGELARTRILEQFGINLAWEIKVIGEN